MRLAFGKVPDVTLGQLFDLVLPVLVNRGDQDTPLVNETPFRLTWSA